MIDEITVSEVIEMNNCAGRKLILVTSMEEDEIVKSKFRLTHGFVPAPQKLRLASVCPTDRVRVAVDSYFHDPLVMGEFFQLLADDYSRPSICSCSTPMVSDGFEVYCPNPFCGMTIAARIDRLGNTAFFRDNMLRYDEEARMWGLSVMGGRGSITAFNPFYPIIQGSFWGQPIQTLDKILLNDRFSDINLGTFLIEPFFTAALDSYAFPETLSIEQYQAIHRFYGFMNELINRRDYQSDDQNYLIFEFISCLGIESLNASHINKLIQYEQCISHIGSPFLTYAYALTNYDELVRELGFHPLEAVTIVGEIRRRKHELFDIFHHYTHHSTDVVKMFGNL